MRTFDRAVPLNPGRHQAWLWTSIVFSHVGFHQEAVEIAQGLARKVVESCIEHGDPLPPAFAKARRAPRELIVPVGIR